MSSRVISPPLSEIGDLSPPLTAGERQVLEFFRSLLPEEWEIYIQPHLNGLRPDFVLLHPENGIAVFEVKDWNLDWEVHCFGGSPPMLRTKADDRDCPEYAENPVEKTWLYKQEICGLYCPSFYKRRDFGVVTAGVIFPRCSTKTLKELFGGPYEKDLRHDQNILVSREQLESGKIQDVFPLVARDNPAMTPEIAEELRPWLVEPSVSSEQRQPLELDSEQKELVTGRTASGYRRIKGAAGSGKSLVLAARAAELLLNEKKVLVITYNITLLSYLKDLSVRWPRTKGGVEAKKFTWRNITWLNFHSWCKRVCLSTGNGSRYSNLGPASGQGDDWSDSLSDLVRDIFREERNNQEIRYDAVIVDEGQDFRLSWWDALRPACRKDGEMLLAADPTQDIYGTARAWTDEAMNGAGFRGPWKTLHRSYRLPAQLVPLARCFAESFLPADELRALPEAIERPLGENARRVFPEALDLPLGEYGRRTIPEAVDLPLSEGVVRDLPETLELPLGEVHLRWIQATEEEALEACESELLAIPGRVTGAPLPWADITFLTRSKKFGRSVVEKLEERGIRILHTFDEGDQGRSRKLAFFKGAPRVKATTLHSFKGWEGRALVVHLADLWDPQAMAAAYTALTRLKRDTKNSVLSVVSTWPDFEKYGRTWPVFRFWPEAKTEDDARALPDFDLQWRGLMAAIDKMDGISVDPGDDVMADDRVVGLDLATVRRGERCLRLVDDTKQPAEQVSSALESQGHRVMRIRPDEPDLFDKIISALEAG